MLTPGEIITQSLSPISLMSYCGREISRGKCFVLVIFADLQSACAWAETFGIRHLIEFNGKPDMVNPVRLTVKIGEPES